MGALTASCLPNHTRVLARPAYSCLQGTGPGRRPANGAPVFVVWRSPSPFRLPGVISTAAAPHRAAVLSLRKFSTVILATLTSIFRQAVSGAVRQSAVCRVRSGFWSRLLRRASPKRAGQGQHDVQGALAMSDRKCPSLSAQLREVTASYVGFFGARAAGAQHSGLLTELGMGHLSHASRSLSRCLPGTRSYRGGRRPIGDDPEFLFQGSNPSTWPQHRSDSRD